MGSEKILLDEFYKNRKIKSALLFSIIAFFIPYLIICIICALNLREKGIEFDNREKAAIIMALLWTALGPWSTFVVFEKIRALRNSIKKVCEDFSFENGLFLNYFHAYQKTTFCIGLIWSILRIFLLGVMPDFNTICNSFAKKPLFVIIFIISYFTLSWLQAYGFSALILVYGAIRQIVSTEGLLKKMLENNYYTGLKPIGRLIIAVVICCASGALFFPLYMLLGKDKDVIYKRIIITMILIAVIALMVILINLYMMVKKAATSAKWEIAGEFKSIYDEKTGESIEGKYSDSKDGVRLELQIQNVYQMYKEACNINAKPIDLKALGTAFCTILVPILVYIQDIIEYFKNIFM